MALDDFFGADIQPRIEKAFEEAGHPRDDSGKFSNSENARIDAGAEKVRSGQLDRAKVRKKMQEHENLADKADELAAHYHAASVNTGPFWSSGNKILTGDYNPDMHMYRSYDAKGRAVDNHLKNRTWNKREADIHREVLNRSNKNEKR